MNMFTGYVVKMEYSEYMQLKRTLNLLDSQEKFLKEKVKTDSDLTDLLDTCTSASACLEDYLDAYDRQFENDRDEEG